MNDTKTLEPITSDEAHKELSSLIARMTNSDIPFTLIASIPTEIDGKQAGHAHGGACGPAKILHPALTQTLQRILADNQLGPLWSRCFALAKNPIFSILQEIVDCPDCNPKPKPEEPAKAAG